MNKAHELRKGCDHFLPGVYINQTCGPTGWFQVYEDQSEDIHVKGYGICGCGQEEKIAFNFYLTHIICRATEPIAVRFMTRKHWENIQRQKEKIEFKIQTSSALRDYVIAMQGRRKWK